MHNVPLLHPEVGVFFYSFLQVPLSELLGLAASSPVLPAAPELAFVTHPPQNGLHF